MAEQNKTNEPNEASRKSKAEGERWDSARTGGGSTDQQGGITNRPLDEEQRNQERLPDRGDAKPGAHAGHGGGGTAEGSER